MTIMNSIISGSTNSLIVYFLYPRLVNKDSNSAINVCNGVLSGLVSITGSCNNVENYSAFVIGVIGGFVFILSCRLMERLKIDDPCSASQIHCFCGFWGALAVGIFEREKGLIYSGDFK